MVEINREQLLKLNNKEKAKILKYIALGLVKYIGENYEKKKSN